ncbi:MAG: fumarylacetoacetase [Frankiales bacterium]|nr:fumarylacetoacetase [Frankiales bacterium]
MTGWLALPEDHPFGLHHLPYGVMSIDHGEPRAVVRIGDQALDLAAATAATRYRGIFDEGNLDRFLAAGRNVWSEVRALVTTRLSDPGMRAQTERQLTPVSSAAERLPFTVMDYVDFYASENHASNVGRIFRPDGEALTANWKHMPIGYHGRAGTVVVSGSDLLRPSGQLRGEDGPRFGPTERLDFEAEVGFVVGRGSEPGKPVPTGAFRDHVFGVCLLNDWSARDIQAWEYVPLGPFLGKSFATSVSAWITPLEALDGVWRPPPPRTAKLLPYLDDAANPAGLHLDLEVSINGCLVSRPPFATMYWTVAQFVAHTTVNGAHLRTGDLLGSGTVSGPEPAQRGSLLELSWAGTEPIRLADGTTRQFLLDGDEVVMRATAVTSNGPIGLGEVRGRVLPAGPAS